MNTFILAADAAAAAAPADAEKTGNPILNLIVFGAFLVVTMYVVLRAGKSTKQASDFYTGVVSCLVLIALSPAVSGTPSSMFPNMDWAIFPLNSPGIVTIPLSFFVGWIVSLLTPPDGLDELADEMEVRSLTGVGVEAPVDH